MVSSLGISYTLSKERNATKKMTMQSSRSSFRIMVGSRFHCSEISYGEFLEIKVKSLKRLAETIGVIKRRHILKDAESYMNAIVVPWVGTGHGRAIVIEESDEDMYVFHPVMLCNAASYDSEKNVLRNVPYIQANLVGHFETITFTGALNEEDSIRISHKQETTSLKFQFTVIDSRGFMSSGST